ncbi:MAG TPA: hypothetical protein VFI59_13960 [Actinomycetota bacterium]|nr:hypothetical protein [Actinomycetota bacterium]
MRLTPEEMRGRVVGVLRTLMQSTPPVGGALAGVLLGGPAVALPLLVMSGVMAVRVRRARDPRPRPRRRGERSRRPISTVSQP